MKDFDSTYPSEYGCQNYCRQGRKRCPCPQACEVPEEQTRSWITRVVKLLLVLGVAVVSAAILG